MKVAKEYIDGFEFVVTIRSDILEKLVAQVQCDAIQECLQICENSGIDNSPAPRKIRELLRASRY